MNLYTFILTSLLSVTFPAPSYSDWMKIDEDPYGNILYVDSERIRKVDGYVYYWTLLDYLKPIGGFSSAIVHNQGDCKLVRYKFLSDSYYTKSMGEGIPSKTNNEPDKNWSDIPPDTLAEFLLKSVCNR